MKCEVLVFRRPRFARKVDSLAEVVGKKLTSFSFSSIMNDKTVFLGLALFVPYDLIK